MAVPVRYVPGRQEMHEPEFIDARVVEYVPVMQLVHRLDMVAPVPVLYLPAWQLSQFTPDQLAGGWTINPFGYSCQE